MNSTYNAHSIEVQKFSEKANHWWDPDGPLKTLHSVNPLRLDFIRAHTSLTPSERWLDVGCGGGILSEALARIGLDVVGIDLSSELLQCGRQHSAHTTLSLQYRLISVESLAVEQPCSFDGITCMEMLEHVPHPVSVVHACAELVKPGGHVFFSTLNRNMKAYLLAIVGAEYLLNMIPRGTHDFSTFIRPSELSAWARNAGLSLIGMSGIVYHPLTQQFQLHPHDMDVNYLAAFQKPGR